MWGDGMARPVGPKPDARRADMFEARRAESGSGVLGEVAANPLPTS